MRLKKSFFVTLFLALFATVASASANISNAAQSTFKSNGQIQQVRKPKRKRKAAPKRKAPKRKAAAKRKAAPKRKAAKRKAAPKRKAAKRKAPKRRRR